MPNHVDNYLEITGKPKLINKLMKQVEITESEATREHSKTIFSCHKVIPQPVLQGEDWYWWRVSNWGSKWDIYDIAITDSDWESGHWALYFQTAWSPITPTLVQLAIQYPKLKFHYRYYESGNDFWGKETYQGGMRVGEEGGELSTASCDIRIEAFGVEHHWCRNCGDTYSCNGNDELCDPCIEEELKLEDELLTETENLSDESNILQVGINN